MKQNSLESLPVAVIGGGPIGLAAAAHLVARGLPTRLYEAGDAVGTSLRDWGHVRVFTPWRYCIDTASQRLLEQQGWRFPSANDFPTGAEIVSDYLEPLAATPELAGLIETGARVVAISRLGMDKVVSRDRETRPFVLSVRTEHGHRRDLARAVIDATGTWATPNPLGANGLAAGGEPEFADRIAYGIPDVLGRDRDVYAGRTTLVVGAGHSAANALLDLTRLADSDASTNRMNNDMNNDTTNAPPNAPPNAAANAPPNAPPNAAANVSTKAVWATRGVNLLRIYGGGDADQLPSRGELGADTRNLVDSGRVPLVAGFAILALRKDGERIIVEGETAEGPKTIGPVDRIIVATGQRPDLSMTRELRLDLDPLLESTKALGPLIDPNEHSCGSVPPHGHRELAHPDAGFYTAGIKSYGRAPTFLLMTGYEQVRSIAAALAGDMAAADDVQLVLPETGVCNTTFAIQSNAMAACCGSASPKKLVTCCASDEPVRDAGKSVDGCQAAR